MTDIFVRTRTNNPIRLAIAEACFERLQLLGDARVHLIGAAGFARPAAADRLTGGSWLLFARDFHVKSRQLADEKAEGGFYVVIDDDCMPIGKDWLDRGLEAMAIFPQFSALASWSINGEIDPAKCALPPQHDDRLHQVSEIFEVPSLGTPTFIRRYRNGERIQLNLPEAPIGQYDLTISQAYLEHGRIGMLRHVRHNHLGYGLSEVVPDWWLA
jgi:hypothetical protein